MKTFRNLFPCHPRIYEDDKRDSTLYIQNLPSGQTKNSYGHHIKITPLSVYCWRNCRALARGFKFTRVGPRGTLVREGLGEQPLAKKLKYRCKRWSNDLFKGWIPVFTRMTRNWLLLYDQEKWKFKPSRGGSKVLLGVLVCKGLDRQPLAKELKYRCKNSYR